MSSSFDVDSEIFLGDLAEQISSLSARAANVRGRSCDLYTGWHRTEGKVALKRPRISEDDYELTIVRRFLREAKTWRGLQHPNVLRFLGACKIDGILYLVSPFMKNGTIIDFIGKHPQNANQMQLIREIASALEYLHARNIIHGDLKGTNILVSDDEHSLVCDFGLSRMQDVNTSTTLKGAGTVRWQAPEIWDNASKSFKTDVYAFAMTIVEIISRDIPFKQYAEDTAVIMAVHFRNERPSREPLRSPDGVPYEWLWCIISGCWDKNPDKRPCMSRVTRLLGCQPASPLLMEGTRQTNDLSDGPIPLVEAQRPPLSPSLRCIPAFQDEIATVQLTNPFATHNVPSTSVTPVTRTYPGRSPGPQPPETNSDMVAFLHALLDAVNGRVTESFHLLSQADSWNTSDSSTGHADQILSIVPCWDMIGDKSTCPVITNPGSNTSLDTLLKVGLRTEELVAKFKSDRNPSWLKRASHIFDHVLAVPGHPSEQILGGLRLLQASICSELFRTTEDVSFLDQSIAGYQTGLTLVPRDAAQCHGMLYLVGCLLNQRHGKNGRREDLDQAIEAYREALASWPQDEAVPLELVSNLGTALSERCETGGDLSDVESAIHRLDGLLSVMDNHHPWRPRVLSNLGVAFRTRCERTRSMADAERAILHLKDALSLQTDDSQDRPGTLTNLARTFTTRHDISGRVSDLYDAIHLFQMALSLRKDDPQTLNSLSIALWTRYKRTGDATDLGQAITHIGMALSLVKNDDPRRAGYLGNWALRLFDRYGVSKDVGDLNKAIGLLDLSLSILPADHPGRPGSLNNLSHALIVRFLRSGNPSDKNRGLGCLTESLSLIPSDHPRRHERLFNLLLTRSTLAPWDSLSIDDVTLVLDQCIELVRLTPQQHPRYSKTVTMVVPILLTCHKRRIDIHPLLLAVGLSSESSAEDVALMLLDRGSKASASPSRFRLEVTYQWIHLCQVFNRPCTLEMFTRMFDLLDLSIALDCSLETRHKQRSTDGYILPAKTLVPTAVAFAIEQGVFEMAVEFLERGQSVLLAQSSRYQTSSLLRALHSVRPDLASRFHDLSWQVEHAKHAERQQPLGSGLNRPLEDPISRLKIDWEDVVQQVRTLDGFHHFLRPTPFTGLRQAAAEGPIILVNISKSRSDAIIVTSNQQSIVVPLPFATPDRVDRLVSAFKAAPHLMSDRNALVALGALCDTIVKPVVTELQGALELPNNSRIWWCPTGSILSLPLHAAGRYQLRDGHPLPTDDCLPYLYISSYTPTLGALIRARQDRQHYSGPPSVLLVGQPNTPHQPEISQVREEIRLIKKRIPHSLVLMDDHSTCDAVLAALTQHQWVHLACYTHIQNSTPFHSHFSLNDGPLPLLEIVQRRLPTAEFAFISALHSTPSGSYTSSETIHLAAGMQLAGFRGIVGTMWVMADGARPLLAYEFYRRMLPKEGDVDHTMAARALHRATRALRKSGAPLAVWINFVHWGA